MPEIDFQAIFSLNNVYVCAIHVFVCVCKVVCRKDAIRMKIDGKRHGIGKQKKIINPRSTDK